jgi:hypothetical protein
MFNLVMSNTTPLADAWKKVQSASLAEQSAARILANPDHNRQSQRAAIALDAQHEQAMATLEDAIKTLLSTTRTRR